MAEPKWLDRFVLLQAHDEVIELTGGATGVRDMGLLESALARAENLYAYEQVDDIPMLAAVYAVSIAKNHPFIDGNKRSAFVGMVVFLGRNGLILTASQVAASDVMLAVAAGEIHVDDLAAWIRENSIAR